MIVTVLQPTWANCCAIPLNEMWRKGKRTPRWCARGEEKLAHLPIDGAEFRPRTIFDDASVMSKWAAIKSWRRHNKQDTPFCRMVPSFCSPICCLIPGLSYGQDWWCRVKIILHRIISVVWLTNFPSEIRNLINPQWWVEQQLLSVKRYQNSLQRSETLMIAHLPITKEGGGSWCCLSGFLLKGVNSPIKFNDNQMCK